MRLHPGRNIPILVTLVAVIMGGWQRNPISGSCMGEIDAFAEQNSANLEDSGPARRNPQPDLAPQTRGLPTGQFEFAPSVFVENLGQWKSDATRFALCSSAINVGLCAGELHFQVFIRDSVGMDSTQPLVRGKSCCPTDISFASAQKHNQTRVNRFSVRFDGSNRIDPQGIRVSNSVFHFHKGPICQWVENVPSFEAVSYPDLYDGIELVVTGDSNRLKYEFHVAPGADWRQIQFHYDGISSICLGEEGTLLIDPGDGYPILTDAQPVSYQIVDGTTSPIETRFVVSEGSKIGFMLSNAYNPKQPLVIDPYLEWSSYLGGGSLDEAWGIAIDRSNNVLAVGSTYSSGWVSGGTDTILNGDESEDEADAFVVK